MPSLRSAMESFLKRWRNDVAPGWRGLLNNVEPDYEAVDPDLSLRAAEPIFPGRKSNPPSEAPPGSHVFRCLDGIRPEDVRAVVVGQDPYPRISRATGRAFEQGDIVDWASAGRDLSPSLRRIMQQGAAARTGNDAYARAGGWAQLKVDVASGAFAAASVAQEFDRWQRQGVLFLNAALTLTLYAPGGGPHQLRGHIPLWQPLVGAICMRLARRKDTPTVFLSWGVPARRFLAARGITRSAERSSAVAEDLPNTAVVYRNHPAHYSFLHGENVFLETNRALTERGASSIDW